MTEREAPQIDRVKDLQDYLGASAGRRIMKDPSRGQYAVSGWHNVYIAKMGKVAEKDPALLGLAQRALSGYTNRGDKDDRGGLTDPEVLKSLNYYADIFQATYEASTVGELLKFFEGTGKLKPRTAALLSTQADKKVGEIQEEGLKNLAETVFGTLREYAEEKMVFGLVNKTVDGNLGGLEKKLEEMENAQAEVA